MALSMPPISLSTIFKQGSNPARFVTSTFSAAFHSECTRRLYMTSGPNRPPLTFSFDNNVVSGISPAVEIQGVRLDAPAGRRRRRRDGIGTKDTRTLSWRLEWPW
jgi:hypothetical protein